MGQPVAAARGATRSPVVDSLLIAVAVAAVLVVFGGVLALQSNHDVAANAWDVPTSVANDGTAPTVTTPPDPDLESASAAPAPAPTGGVDDLVAGTDRQGFLAYPGARCDFTNPAVAIGRTVSSLVVICETGVGRLYYKGMRLGDGSSVEIDDPVRTVSGFLVTNAGVQYMLSRAELVITSGGTQLADEAMLSYWSD
ncbi:hypothetical protein K7711_11360 [Nocardia sp. CA2R105]|uniref:hypothetical protein n=1 Tax=Nocardia coffeae TaxID=2873381 RepID=UPI001CA640FF|nr:hypothetical protein [Nocardia coffeae]MBY8857076.1 hypothetical protein [Nocardia coffeae]